MYKIFTIIVALLMFVPQAFAQKAADIAQIENYLNNIKTLKASFVQIASNANTSEGKLYIAKPNKIRMEYAAPVNVDIIGDGNFIVYNDKELDQVTHIDYDDVPASIILANDIKIDGRNIKLVDFYKDAGTTEAVLEYNINGTTSPITLVFSNSPFELKQWKLVDQQGTEISVSLYNYEQDVPLDSSLFKFKKNQKTFNKRRG